MNLKELETKTLIDPFLNSLNYKNFTKDEIINKQESTIKNLINEISKLSDAIIKEPLPSKFNKFKKSNIEAFYYWNEIQKLM